MYDIYKTARDAAWKFLLENNICSLPVNLGLICKNNGILLLREKKPKIFTSSDRGMTYLRDGQYRIIVNGIDPKPVQRYTVAHELGHIYMSHPMSEGLYGRSYGIQRASARPIEYQAERFAIGILAPACILWGLGVRSAQEIADLCDISLRAAEIRAERMTELYLRDSFLRHPLEKEVFEQFKDFIVEKPNLHI